MLVLPDMGSPSVNRSLFGVRSKYTNLNITVINEANMSWGSTSYGFAMLQSLIDDSTT